MIPERLLDIVRRTDSTLSHFPSTLFYNEGWMLKLLLDAFQTEGIRNHPLSFQTGARWYSEARLPSPFSAEKRGDGKGEGSTCADGTLGHFEFRKGTIAGLVLKDSATQFIVTEAKMGSKLSAKTTNAPGYDQAARNVACMAEAIRRWIDSTEKNGEPRSLGDLTSVGFYVIAPSDTADKHSPRMEVAAIRTAVEARMRAYNTNSSELETWGKAYFTPLMDRISNDNLKILSWESCIEAVRSQNQQTGDELFKFYSACLEQTKIKTNPDHG